MLFFVKALASFMVIALLFTDGQVLADNHANRFRQGPDAIAFLKEKFDLTMGLPPTRWPVFVCNDRAFGAEEMKLCRAEDSQKKAHINIFILPTAKMQKSRGEYVTSLRGTVMRSKDLLVQSQQEEPVSFKVGQVALNKARVYWARGIYIPYVSVLHFESNGHTAFVVISNHFRGDNGDEKPLDAEEVEIAGLFHLE